MADFLVVIPRSPMHEEDQERRYNHLQRKLKSVRHTYNRYLPQERRDKHSISWPAPERTVAVLSWSYNGCEQVSINRDFWSVAAGSDVGERLAATVSLRGGSLAHSAPVWGSYAAAFGERYSRRVWFWNTTPALEAIHYSADVEFVYVSNRPLLVALALSNGHPSVSLNHGYVSEYLHFGYSVSGETPFSGVRTIAVNQCLVIDHGDIYFRDAPQQVSSLEREHSETEGAEALAEALENSIQRSACDIDQRTVQLRLSGGKDSRLLAGLLRKTDTRVHAVTYGVNQDVEVKLAKNIADLAGFEHLVTAPLSADGETIRQCVNQTIFECGGIPASEAHLGATAGAEVRFPGQPIMLGQWPLTKGGIAKVMRYPAGGIRSAVQKQGSRLLSASEATYFDGLLDNWFDSVAASTELEKLYLFAREFRSGRYLHSHISHYARDAQIVYPISDAEVTSVCDALNMGEKISQRALFLAMRRIWPEVMELPLHGSVWRFEVGGPADISEPGYSSRTTSYMPTDEFRNTKNDAASTTGTSERVPIELLAGEVVGGDRWLYLHGLLKDEVAAAVEATAAGTPSLPSGMSNREFYKNVWRLLLADAWLSGDWLQLLRNQ